MDVRGVRGPEDDRPWCLDMADHHIAWQSERRRLCSGTLPILQLVGTPRPENTVCNDGSYVSQGALVGRLLSIAKFNGFRNPHVDGRVP